MNKITVGQINELIEQSKGENSRINRENLQAFLRNPNSIFGSSFLVTVDYDKTIQEMFKNGRYDNNIDLSNSFFEEDQVGEGKVDVRFELVTFKKDVCFSDVLYYFSKYGLRVATVKELLAFGATHPEIQRKCFIVASVSSPRGGYRCPCTAFFLEGDEKERRLEIGNLFLNSGWRSGCRFLAVPTSIDD